VPGKELAKNNESIVPGSAWVSRGDLETRLAVKQAADMLCVGLPNGRYAGLFDHVKF
jgi:hypothetical protein